MEPGLTKSRTNLPTISYKEESSTYQKLIEIYCLASLGVDLIYCLASLGVYLIYCLASLWVDLISVRLSKVPPIFSKRKDSVKQ